MAVRPVRTAPFASVIVVAVRIGTAVARSIVTPIRRGGRAIVTVRGLIHRRRAVRAVPPRTGVTGALRACGGSTVTVEVESAGRSRETAATTAGRGDYGTNAKSRTIPKARLELIVAPRPRFRS